MPLKPFAEMSPADYAEIGFRSGLEIHQQLLTSRKLFCRCPAGEYSDQFNAEILRHMRPTLSELGEYDGTALMEFKTKKEIIYQIHRDTVCTYEMDDTPPFELNPEALDIALTIGQMYGCSMVDEIHIARKQYLDGSIPTGFQRTTIVGVEGSIPFKDRSIRIIQLGLEEDACREVSDIGHRRVYLTDRLGMPLIETVTAPDMQTPQEVAEVADVLRRMVRSTGLVRTGAGAARQDVNVSVTGGTRIEIKGVPRIPNIPLLTYNEAARQVHLLLIRAELHRRGITPDAFRAHSVEVTRHLRKTRFQPIRDSVAAGHPVMGVRLIGYRGILRWPTQTDTQFSREISDRVRVVACLTTLPNIIHSDSPSETLSSSEWQEVRRSLGATDDDTIVIVWGPKQDATLAASEIILRAREATIGIPSETRQALRDGTNGFERILPGPDRMYPDTDLPPIRIRAERLAELKQRIPRPYREREKWYGELGVPADCIAPLSISPLAPLFEEGVNTLGLSPVRAAVILVQLPKRVSRTLRKRVEIPVEVFRKIFLALRDRRLAPEGVLPLLIAAAGDTGSFPDQLPGPVPLSELDRLIEEIRTGLRNLHLHTPERAGRIVMGQVMERVRGRNPGREVAARVTAQMGKGVA